MTADSANVRSFSISATRTWFKNGMTCCFRDVSDYNSDVFFMYRYPVGTSFAVEKVISVDVQNCRALRPSTFRRLLITPLIPTVKPYSTYISRLLGKARFSVWHLRRNLLFHLSTQVSLPHLYQLNKHHSWERGT